MKRLFLTMALVVSVVLALSAARPTVYVQEFTNTAGVKDGWVEAVRSAVIEGFHKTNRMVIVDAITESTRYEEEMRRLKENLSTDDLESTAGLETRGAHFLLNGDVTAVTVTGKKLDSGTMSYEATATFTLKLVNALDGALIGSKSFNLPSFADMIKIFAKVCESEDAAVQAITGLISSKMKDFVDKSVPVVGPFEDVDKLKNGKEVETFYVGLGELDGVVKGLKLDVKVQQKIGKKIALKKIGEAEIVEVAGDDISLCKVKRGGEEIKSALDQSQKIFVTSRE